MKLLSQRRSVCEQMALKQNESYVNTLIYLVVFLNYALPNRDCERMDEQKVFLIPHNRSE